MVYYTCERCGYQTHHKSVFRKHLYRKRVCKPIVLDIPIEVLREELEKECSFLKEKARKTRTCVCC